ncbi:hypothetical protein EJ04DRAFT_479759 [Polyplosphaeria fusca]|uniref:Uncharacterized protein n=1 Tax=Polyplosphaeria fusca TaxID=682080 RepID=A0A9P4QLB2_9PLEO|nr:hypothetical protein EJ04DRAFT_479759 [Polyplosphaeria fusca]
MASAAVCPVVGTTNDVLPPNHPEVDLSKDGQTCPVVGAKTEHHHNLHKHPSVPVPKDTPTATECPVLQNVVTEQKSKDMDDKVCPVIGPATTILPPDHPDPSKAKDGDVCPVTKAQVGHHKDKVMLHPAVEGQEKGATCPVTGAKA